MKFDRPAALAFLEPIWKLKDRLSWHVDLSLGSANTPSTWYLADYKDPGELVRQWATVAHHFEGNGGLLVAYDGDELQGGKPRHTLQFDDFHHEHKLLEVSCKGLFLPTLTNKREHWGRALDRSQVHRGQTALFANQAIGAARARHTLRYTLDHGGLLVRITRVAKKFCDHGDGTNTACKHVRDGLADALGVDDGRLDISWEYEQRLPREKESPGAFIEVFARGQCPTCNHFVPRRS